MKYPEVKRAHIVPRCYLLNFAVEESVVLNVDGKAIPKPTSIDDAAVRRTFYRRYRPDGTPIDDVEWSLSQLEGVIGSMLPAVREAWPYAMPEKAKLAEFFAFQLVRGPRWKQWREEEARKRIEEQRRNPEPILHNGLWLPVTHKTINELEERLLSETEWLVRMMSIANKLVDVFGSMRWHLIEFDRPLLAISDHPVVGWHTKADLRHPEPNAAGVGALNFLEVRVPISPTLALLMTWQDLPDAEKPSLGSEAIAANINAFTVANAERQWMHQPGSTPPIARGYLPPAAPMLISGYGPSEVEASEVRRLVSKNIQPKLGENFGDTAEIVTARVR
jgi:Protein of unknown function (DUF4238)